MELNLLATLALATALFFIGQRIVQRSGARRFRERTKGAVGQSGNP